MELINLKIEKVILHEIFKRLPNGDRVYTAMSVGIDMARFNKLMTHMGFSCCGSNFSLQLAEK